MSLAYLCAGKGAKEFSVNVKSFVIDMNYHFGSAKRKNQLREFMNLGNYEIRITISHILTKWLSLEKYLERTLMQ